MNTIQSILCESIIKMLNVPVSPVTQTTIIFNVKIISVPHKMKGSIIGAVGAFSSVPLCPESILGSSLSLEGGFTVSWRQYDLIHRVAPPYGMFFNSLEIITYWGFSVSKWPKSLCWVFLEVSSGHQNVMEYFFFRWLFTNWLWNWISWRQEQMGWAADGGPVWEMQTHSGKINHATGASFSLVKENELK